MSNPIKTIPTKPPIKAEIIIFIPELNKGKAPVMDNVVPEVLKRDPELTVKIFKPFLKEIRETRSVARRMEERNFN
jgi:hypothetical protein